VSDLDEPRGALAWIRWWLRLTAADLISGVGSWMEWRGQRLLERSARIRGWNRDAP
jgi:ABC-type nickel/cobalt efflux system permease component RcnA